MAALQGAPTSTTNSQLPVQKGHHALEATGGDLFAASCLAAGQVADHVGGAWRACVSAGVANGVCGYLGLRGVSRIGRLQRIAVSLGRAGRCGRPRTAGSGERQAGEQCCKSSRRGGNSANHAFSRLARVVLVARLCARQLAVNRRMPRRGEAAFLPEGGHALVDGRCTSACDNTARRNCPAKSSCSAPIRRADCR